MMVTRATKSSVYNMILVPAFARPTRADGVGVAKLCLAYAAQTSSLDLPVSSQKASCRPGPLIHEALHHRCSLADTRQIRRFGLLSYSSAGFFDFFQPVGTFSST